MKQKVLSICIPTYNRKETICNTIQEILKCDSDDFNIIVSDNASPDNTFDVLQTIKDSRLIICKNETNIGGVNSIKIIAKGEAKYTLLLLDKDYIDYHYLEAFIEYLRNKEFGNGFCELNVEHESDNSVFEPGFSSLIHTSYLSKHPSGMVWNTNQLRKTNIIEKLIIMINSNMYNSFGFHGELINSFIAMTSNLPAFIYNQKLVYTEKPENSKTIKTKIYNKDNVYFSPKMRFQECKIYLNDLLQYNFTKKQKKIINRRLIKSFIRQLFEYSKIKNENEKLQHYGLLKTDIHISSIFKYFIYFLGWYLFKYKGNNFVNKFYYLLWIF